MDVIAGVSPLLASLESPSARLYAAAVELRNTSGSRILQT